MSAASRISAPRAIIAEDETAQRRELRATLADLWPELEIVAECEDGLAALEAVAAHRPDVVFLDIRMPGLSGLEVARAAAGNAQVVLITAYDAFALEAFDKGAIDYLLKPVKRERLAVTVERLRHRLAQGEPRDVEALLKNLQDRLGLTTPSRISWISASSGGTIRMIAIDDVVMFRAEDKYTAVITASGVAHIRTPLKDLLVQLDPDAFWQVHRSVIVRVAAIRAIRRDDDGRLRLQVAGHAETVPVSASLQERFKPM